MKYNIETKNIMRVVNIIKRMTLIKDLKNNVFIQQLLRDIRSKL